MYFRSNRTIAFPRWWTPNGQFDSPRPAFRFSLIFASSAFFAAKSSVWNKAGGPPAPRSLSECPSQPNSTVPIIRNSPSNIQTWSAKAASLASAGAQFYSDHTAKQWIRKFRNFHGQHTLVSRCRSATKLLVIAAGYKPALFPLTLDRAHRFVPAGWDVCLCCAGRDVPELRHLCEERSWSYLTTAKNQISLAQNLAIRNHPAARVIVKMDEDIFLAEGTLDRLVDALAECEKTSSFLPGIMAPLLNVNGYTSRILLEKLGCLEEFESRFGPCRQACLETPAWRDPNAAQFLWERILPFDDTARRLATDAPLFSPCPHRFSIGCFAMSRELWEEMNGFTVAPEGALGIDEIDLCAYCHAVSKPVMVAHHILAGHAGFGHQMEVMEPWIVGNSETLKCCCNGSRDSNGQAFKS